MSSRKREELHPGGIAVWFDPAKSAVRAFGDLRPGVEYVVAPEEAQRLVRVKRFEPCTPADAAALAALDAPAAPESDAEAAPAKPSRRRGNTEE
jgi:hypothetical protein